MKRGGLILLALAFVSACAPTSLFRRKSTVQAEARADSLYWSAVANLDPRTRSGTLDAAIANLDAYLASPYGKKHESEATALRAMARNSIQLARLEAALTQARASAPSVAVADTPSAKPEPKQRADSDSKGRDQELVKEVQRLKDELAKANDELERIKKRLAAQTKP